MARKARVTRKTRETDIKVELNLDGSGKGDIKTTIPFFDHMLTNFSRHGLFDLKLRATGDTEIDLHHTVEDVGITLGEAIRKALGSNAGIRRCASAAVPMMDALSTVILDISNRPFYKFSAAPGTEAIPKTVYSATGDGTMREAFDLTLANEFMRALTNAAGLDMHVVLHYGEDVHHSIESIFKALGRALSAAVAKDPRIKGVLSTKGKL